MQEKLSALVAAIDEAPPTALGLARVLLQLQKAKAGLLEPDELSAALALADAVDRWLERGPAPGDGSRALVALAAALARHDGGQDRHIDCLEHALDLEPNTATVETLVEALVARTRPGDRQRAADLLHMLGDLAEGDAAIGYCERALDLNPGHADALARLEALIPAAERVERLQARWRAFTETSQERPAAEPAPASESIPVIELDVQPATGLVNDGPSIVPSPSLNAYPIDGDFEEVVGLPEAEPFEVQAREAQPSRPDLETSLTPREGEVATLRPRDRWPWLPLALVACGGVALSVIGWLQYAPTAAPRVTPLPLAGEQLLATAAAVTALEQAPTQVTDAPNSLDVTVIEAPVEPAPATTVGQGVTVVEAPAEAPPAGVEVALVAGKTRVRGARIPKRELREGLQALLPALRACYDDRLAHRPTLRGRLAFSWVVRRNGAVRRVRRRQDSVGDAAMRRCATRALRAASFPRPKGRASRVRAAFDFSPTPAVDQP